MSVDDAHKKGAAHKSREVVLCFCFKNTGAIFDHEEQETTTHIVRLFHGFHN